MEYELLSVKLRYKQPDGEKSLLFETPVKCIMMPIVESSENFKFATVVAEFGMFQINF